MDLRKYSPTPEQIAKLGMTTSYQPYILSDTIQTGTCYYWMYGPEVFYMNKNKVSPREWRRFVEANQRMRNMYDAQVDAICQSLGSVTGMTVTDVACNAGYFLYRLLEKGAGTCIGYDLVRGFRRAIRVLNEITHYNVQFINVGYDQMTHRIPDAQQADIVLSTAIMCHLTDPIYHLNFLGTITRKALFLFSTITDESKLRITYKGYKRWPTCQPFPVCFDERTFVSRSLVDVCLKEMGFQKIIDVPYRRDWIPRRKYRDFQAIVALR